MADATETPPLDFLVPFTADGGFYGWSCPTHDGLCTVVVSNEDGDDPRVLGPGETWTVIVLRDSDAADKRILHDVTGGQLSWTVTMLQDTRATGET